MSKRVKNKWPCHSEVKSVPLGLYLNCPRLSMSSPTSDLITLLSKAEHSQSRCSLPRHQLLVLCCYIVHWKWRRREAICSSQLCGGCSHWWSGTHSYPTPGSFASGVMLGVTIPHIPGCSFLSQGPGFQELMLMMSFLIPGSSLYLKCKDVLQPPVF